MNIMGRYYLYRRKTSLNKENDEPQRDAILFCFCLHNFWSTLSHETNYSKYSFDTLELVIESEQGNHKLNT